MSAKNTDAKGHWRCKTINFRLSPEEAASLDMKVKLSGLFKQDYIVNKLLDDEIIVFPNIYTGKYVMEYLKALTNELKNTQSLTQDSYLLDDIKYLIEFIDKLITA